MTCTYTLPGILDTPVSYTELVDEITKNSKKYAKFKNKALEDIVYSLGLSSTVDLINEIKSVITPQESTFFDINAGETLETYNGYKALSNYIDKATTPTGEHFFTSYNEDQYKSEIVDKAQRSKGFTKVEAEEYANKQIEIDHKVGEASAKLHAIFRAYFGGFKNKQAFIHNFIDYFNADILEYLYNSFAKLETLLKTTHGENSTFFASVNLVHKMEDINEDVAATIDLVVVDEQNQAHIYQISGSAKDSDILPKVRQIKKDYHLGFLRQMLASHGVAARNMSLNLINVQLISDEFGLILEAIVKDPEDRKSIMYQGKLNPLAWCYGDYYSNINNKIPIEIPESTNKHINENVREHTIKFFGEERNIAQTVFNNTVQDYIKYNVKESDDLSKGNYKIIVDKKNRSKDIYVHVTGSKYKDPVILEKVTKLVADLQLKSDTFISEFIDNIEGLLKGTKTFASMTAKNSTELREFLTVNFALYQDDPNWTVVKREDLAAAGIIVLRNKLTQQVDFIALRTGNLNAELNLKNGSTILGNFKNNEEAAGTKNLLHFTLGNAALMQIIDFINEDANTFRDFNIGTIKVYNPMTGKATIASTSEILSSYTRLCNLAGVLCNLNDNLFASDLDIFTLYLQSSLKSGIFDYQTSSDIFASLETINPNVKSLVIEVLNKVREIMETKYWDLLKNGDIENITSKFHELVVVIYALLCKAILYYSGIEFTQSNNLLTKYGTSIESGQFLNGTKISNPSTVPEENLRRMVEITRRGFHNMTQEIMDNWETFRNNEVEDLWNSKGYTAMRNNIVGDLYDLYSHMFVHNELGLLSGNLQLKDPDDQTNDLTDDERKFLRSWLKRMEKLRFENLQLIDAAMQDGSYFLIPLVEANLGGKLEGMENPVEYAKLEFKDISVYMKAKFGREEDGVFTPEENKILTDYSKRYEIFNRLEFSYDQDHRDALMALHKINFWETNLDRLYAHYLYASIRKKHLDKVLPVIKALRIVGALYGKQTGTSMKNFDLYIDNYMKSHIHNQSILSDEEKAMIGSVAPLKFIASTLAMGFSATTGLRNLLESVWKVPAAISGQFFARGECFTKKEWMKAMLIMVQDTPDFASKVTLIEALNQRMRILDMDANRIADKITSYKSGLTHTTDRLLFWFSVAPDYFNRMSMIIAQMIHDGCWDACSFTKEKGFYYDWKKDKRFSVYANPNSDKNSAEYKLQRGLYMMLLRTTNEETGANLKEGDDLPLPYTSKQVSALKDFSDTVFGFYDHDQRAMVERGAIASLFTLFKTYLTSARTVWFLAPGEYNKGEVRQMIDEKTGKPMFLKIIETPDGIQTMVPTIEDTGIPWILECNSYMEGIVYSFAHIWLDIRHLGLKQALSNTWNNDIRMRNIKLAAWYLFAALILSFLTKKLLEFFKDTKEEEYKTRTPTVADVVEDAVFIDGLKCLQGCFADANIINSINSVTLDAEPAAFGIITNVFTSTGSFFFGDKTLENWMHINFGLYRSIEPAVETIGKMIKD